MSHLSYKNNLFIKVSLYDKVWEKGPTFFITCRLPCVFITTQVNLFIPNGTLVTNFIFFKKSITLSFVGCFQWHFFKTTYFFNLFSFGQLVYDFESIFPSYFSMASPSEIIFIDSNYLSWKSHIEDLLQSKVL